MTAADYAAVMSTQVDQAVATVAAASTPQRALEFLVGHFSAQTGTVHQFSGDGLLHLVAIVGAFPPPVMDAIRTIPLGKGLAGLAAQRKIPVTVCNIQTDSSGDVRPGAKATGMEGAITVPCLDGRGEVVGVLGVASVTQRTWTDEESALLMKCAAALCPMLR